MNIEHAGGTRKISPLSIIGIILVPLIVAGGFVWAIWHATDRLDNVDAAIVNNDEPATVNGQTVPMGRQLAGGLVKGGDSQSSDGKNYDWQITDSSDAEAGLKSGKYAAVVTIPKNFSKAATSYAKKDGDKARHATLDVTTSNVTGLADPAISSMISSTATKTLNSELTGSYLKNIYVGFNKIGDQFSNVSDATSKLADGQDGLNKGIHKTHHGSQSLANGLDKLGSGADELASGTDKLATGQKGLASGLHQAADGASQLPGQTQKLADGAKKLSSGAGQVADGTQKAAGGVHQLDSKMPALKNGGQQLSDGASKYAAGAKAYAGHMQKLAANCPKQSPGMQRYCAQVQAMADAAGQGSEQQPGLAAGAAGLASSTKSYTGGVSQVADGVTKLDQNMGKLSNGANGVASGADSLASGTQKLADGMGPLSKGLTQSAQGADKLAAATNRLSTGAHKLATGANKSADGAHKLSHGVGKLSKGSDKLTDGTQKLADGLEKGAKSVPSYSKSQRAQLSKVVSSPVKDSGASGSSIFADASASGFLVVIALWIGALVAYLVMRAVTSRVLTSSRPSWMLALRGLMPGMLVVAVQAILLSGLLAVVMDFSASVFTQFFVFSLLAGAAFVAVNHALVALLGGIGRFISVVLVVATAAANILSAIPEFFASITPFLPLTPAIDGLQAIAGGGTGVGSAAGGLLGWLIGGVVVSILAVARRRSASPDGLGHPQEV
ncbi:putative membrane protein [Spelaeicoccus albus]|uniref:Putative membrane protein n=2 Tax=Spelaeicoccus albus TaxID=1280376 RepID=A0A7Z0D245_9MICO|nr:putative membrane protein [Spelaeicoccus albus]